MTELVATAEETVSVEHHGTTYTFPKIDPKDPPVEIMEALEEGKTVGACRLILGDAQWADFKKTRPKASDLNNLLSKALGTDAGK